MITDRNKDIVRLYNEGLSSPDIATKYGISTRQVQRVLAREGVVRTGSGKSKENTLISLREIIIALMREEGRDFNRCESCKLEIPKGKFDIHHTVYEKATYQDLQIVCRRCNTNPLNRYLY